MGTHVRIKDFKIKKINKLKKKKRKKLGLQEPVALWNSFTQIKGKDLAAALEVGVGQFGMREELKILERYSFLKILKDHSFLKSFSSVYC